MHSIVLLLLLKVVTAGEPALTLSGAVVDGDGKPVAGATVVVAEGPPAARLMVRLFPVAAPRASNVLATATTDEFGKFNASLPDEAPESALLRTRLTVWTYHPDFALAVRLIDRDWPRAGLPLTLALRAAASARFKIRDADHRPVAHARITPLRVAGHLVPELLTARFAADCSPDGRAMLAGVAPEELETVRIENEASGVQWAGIPARGRDKSVLLTLAPAGRVHGRLTADGTRAVARRPLRFATWQIPGDEYAGGGLAEVVADDEGNYDVPVIAAGSVTFEIGEGPEAESAAPVYLTGQTTGPAIDGGMNTTFEVPLRRAIQVVQEVRDQEDDTPVAGVRVSMSWRLPGPMSGDTDASGRLSFNVLPGLVAPRPIRIPPPYYDPRGMRITGEAIAESTDAVPLKVMRLARGAPVRGRVVDDNGRPLAGAEVTGFSELGRRFPVHAWSNARGEFAIDAVAAQTPVRLWASHGESTSIEPELAQPGAGVPVTLMVGKKPGVSLEGRVVDAAGRPIAAAVVRVWVEQLQVAPPSIDLGCLLFEGNDRLTTDADGRFHTPPSLRPNAAYSLQVEAPGILPSETEAIEPDSWHTTRFADVVLRPAPRLRVVNGRVIDREGRAVAGAAVWQSGDGPRRTETTTDDEGHFQLGGVYEAPAILLVRNDGFRLQGARIAPDEETRQITLRRSDEPAAAMASLPPLVPLEEQRELAMSLVGPLLPMIRDPVFTPQHNQLLLIISRGDPAQALEIADKVLTHPGYKNRARMAAALSLVSTDFDEGLAVIALVDEPYVRVETCVRACDELIGSPPERRVKLLDEALLQARTEPDPGLRAREFGRIAVRWLDEGQRERGVALLREGQALAEALPGPNEANPRESGQRGPFAGMLARIDGPAALRLIEGFSADRLNNFRTDVARGLADHDPVEAERLFRLIESPPVRFDMRLAPLQRMAAADAKRAARLARTYTDLCERAFALGTVAHGLAAKDRAAAARLLEEAYGLLDGAPRLGLAQKLHRDPALTAAALLPVAEKIDPMLIEGYLWRALSLREPWPAAGESATIQNLHLVDLATMIARYDRGIARDLLAPLTGRMGAALWKGPAVIDARWAAELVKALPDAPAPPANNPKQIAARLLVARWLGLSPREICWTVYLDCNLRDPDTLDDLR